MCYDKETSIVTYTIGTISSLGLLRSENTAFQMSGAFFLFVTQMQLIEYLLWKNYECNNRNRTISNIGSILNHIQPIFLYFIIKYFNKNLSENKKSILNIIILLYITSLILYSKNVYPLECTTLTDTEPPHLDWKWNHKKHSTTFYLIFLVSVILLTYIGFPKPYNIYLAIICLGTYIASYLIYRNENITGAIWCWLAALIPFFLLIIDSI